MDRIAAWIKTAWSIRELRTRILVTAGIFLVFRFLGHIPVPGVDIVRLQGLFEQSQFLGLIDIFSGGTLANFSLMAIGINPYITSSIIMQLATFLFPKLKALSKDGEAGRAQINQYTRLLSLPVAVMQSMSVLAILNTQQLVQTSDPLLLTAMISSLVAGSMILVWLGELVTQHGIGNGISMVIFAGIVGRIPISIAQTFQLSDTLNIAAVLGVVGVGALLIGVMVAMNEAVRKVQMQYARRVRGSRTYGGELTYLPLKLNAAGVLPIIFALSVMLLPDILIRLLQQSGQEVLLQIAAQVAPLANPASFVYSAVYFGMVVAFTYFSSMVFFNPEELADDLKKSGAFIPGIRPGKPTEQYLGAVMNRITLAGAIFLGSIAILPTVAQNLTGLSTLSVGGTGVLIVVSVVLETAKQVRALVVAQNYDRFVR